MSDQKYKLDTHPQNPFRKWVRNNYHNPKWSEFKNIERLKKDIETRLFIKPTSS